MRPSTILKMLAGLAVALVLAGVAVIATLDLNRYKGTIQEEVERLTGRKLVLEGDLDLSLGLTPKLVVNRARFANAPWGSRPDMVTVESVEAEIELIPALKGDIRLTHVILIKPDILLETDRKGTGNWELAGLTAAPAPTPASPAASATPQQQQPSALEQERTPVPTLGTLSIRQARITLKDAQENSTTVFDLENLSLKAPSATAPITLSIRGAYNAIPYAVDGTVGPVQALLGGPAPFPVALKGDFGGIALSADGVVKDPKGVKGIDLKVAVKAEKYDGVKTLIPAEGVPPVTLTGHLTGGGKSWKIDGLDALIAKTRLTGMAAVTTGGARPKLDVALKSPEIDLRDWLGRTETVPPAAAPKAAQPSTPAGGRPARVFPEDPIKLDALRGVDARADVQVAKLTLPNSMVLEAVALKGVLENGRLKLTPAQARVGDGVLAVTLDLAPAAPAGIAALSADVKLDKVVLGRLFEQIGKPDLLSAVPTDGTISLKGQGVSVAALMASLDGAVQVRMGQGKIHNSLIDWIGGDILAQLGEALNPAKERQPYTDLSCGVIRMKVVKGQVDWAKQIAFETTRMNVVSSGAVNLGREELNVAVQPYTKTGTGLSAGKLAEMLRLQGTLAQPKVGIDAQAAAQTALSVGTAVATGGLSSVLGSLGGGNTVDTAPCATALGEKPVPAKQQAPSQTGTQPAKQAVPTDPAGALKQGIGGLFKKPQ